MVGDRMDTDGMFAQQVGCRFALVRSGSTPAGATVADLPAGRSTSPISRPSPRSSLRSA